jgi:hypothetical protein
VFGGRSIAAQSRSPLGVSSDAGHSAGEDGEETSAPMLTPRGEGNDHSCSPMLQPAETPP